MFTRLLKSALILAAASSAGMAQADATATESYSFADIFNLVTMDGSVNDLSNTLIVMDDDDTLTMMPCPIPGDPVECQYLGGPAWFSWQSDLVDQYGTKGGNLLTGQVAATNDALFDISDLLLGLNQMNYADPTIAATLTEFANLGAHMMVITARDTDVVSATQAQLDGLIASGTKSLLDTISENAPIWSASGKPSMAGTQSTEFCNVNIPVAYQNGVAYATGQNKGEILKCFLTKSDVSEITNIVFIDDTFQNVVNVYNSFAVSNDPYDVTAIYFTQLEQHKKIFTLTRPNGSLNEFQTAAGTRWNALQDVLKLSLLQPTGLE